MSSRPELKIDWCTHAAAKYAVEHWHYSRRMPKSKLAKIGVWEDDSFIGAVIFGSGACPQIARPYGLLLPEVAELVRVALRGHTTPVSRIVAIAIKYIRTQFPGLRLIVSYADPEMGHHGGIYQAGNWLYAGKTSLTEWFEVVATGERVHSHVYRRGQRGRATKDKRLGIIRSIKVWKHKYLMPLDKEMKAQIEPLRKPYPKRVRSVDSDTPANQAGKGGAIPTRTLSSKPKE